jgi:hypothetical protein
VRYLGGTAPECYLYGNGAVLQDTTVSTDARHVAAEKPSCSTSQ